MGHRIIKCLSDKVWGSLRLSPSHLLQPITTLCLGTYTRGNVHSRISSIAQYDGATAYSVNFDGFILPDLIDF